MSERSGEEEGVSGGRGKRWGKEQHVWGSGRSPLPDEEKERDVVSNRSCDEVLRAVELTTEAGPLAGGGMLRGGRMGRSGGPALALPRWSW